MTRPIHVLGFAGSLRKGSYNAALLAAAGELLPDGMTLERFDLAPLPIFNEDLAAGGFPDPVGRFHERIAAADALLIATPEYNHSIPGVLKNAIDWASLPPKESPLNDKPVAVLGAAIGTLGKVRAQVHLRVVCAYLNMHVLNKPEVYVGRARDKFDASGRLTDEETRRRVGDLLTALGAWTTRLREVGKT